jgi:hypothetical protein
MSFTLALLLGTALPAAPPALPNLDFGTGRLIHWEGTGFTVGPAGGGGPSLACGVCSSDNGRRGRTALLHRTFTVPPGAGAILFRAAAVRRAGLGPGATLDVVLEAPGRRFIPRQVRTAAGWQSAPRLLPPLAGRLRSYRWEVADLAGQTVRIALLDQDRRPGCHVVCSGFTIESADEANARAFAAHMVGLQRARRLAPMTRLDSDHFVAVGNADLGFCEYRLHNCETIYALFFDHFRRRGFAVREPGVKLMVAVFDSQAGFDAYLERPLSASITGLYARRSNRLLVYDYATNSAFLAGQKQGEEWVRRSRGDLEKMHRRVTFGRHVRDRRDDVNLSTIMHECAHQLSFNAGLLNRTGDVPAWLAEGLACYCEPAVRGAWQGLGEPNPNRARVLAGPARGAGKFLHLRELVRGDDWLRRARRLDAVVLGYSQSWALFTWLMKERPEQLRRYLALIHPRRTPEHRLTDFGQVFGADLERLDRRYRAYMYQLVRQQVTEGR